MKNRAYYIFLLFVIVLYSCNQNSNTANTGTKNSKADSLCYASVLGSDSAKLVLSDQKGIINGTLDLFFNDKDDLTGKISGSFKGDTLYLDYAYRVGKKTEYFQNPFVFLKKDGKYYQGYGEITSTFGRTHFKEGAPIDFTKGFVFSAVDCK
ncbi:MAG TPA: hypothetical protein DIT07_08640 [Sphingobacteriaceae bacterium]|nr:hypothetical protein [Sphingobacteriaceae bacterium]